VDVFWSNRFPDGNRSLCYEIVDFLSVIGSIGLFQCGSDVRIYRLIIRNRTSCLQNISISYHGDDEFPISSLSAEVFLPLWFGHVPAAERRRTPRRRNI